MYRIARNLISFRHLPFYGNFICSCTVQLIKFSILGYFRTHSTPILFPPLSLPPNLKVYFQSCSELYSVCLCVAWGVTCNWANSKFNRNSSHSVTQFVFVPSSSHHSEQTLSHTVFRYRYCHFQANECKHIFLNTSSSSKHVVWMRWSERSSQAPNRFRYVALNIICMHLENELSWKLL